ncbi:MAG: 23S rRNA (pseudouridine(1915)-N(3))-methyltransferase RlmH [Moorellales bacterium]
MRLEVIVVGRLRQPYLKTGIEDYARRLRRYVSLELVEVREVSLPPEAPAAEVEAAKVREGEEILGRIAADTLTVALDEGGELFSSPELARWLAGRLAEGASRVAFVIGGPRGLAHSVLARANLRLSLSRLTFPHELCCLILLEQLYRAFKILRREPYHY